MAGQFVVQIMEANINLVYELWVQTFATFCRGFSIPFSFMVVQSAIA
jgi:hypothetical protein